MGILGLVTSSWIISLFLVFNTLNAKDNFRLFFEWAKLTGELTSDRNYKVAGLSRAKYRKFLEAEDRFLDLWSKTLNWCLLAFSFVYNALFFVIKFDVDVITYVLMQTINIAHTTYFVFTYLPSIYTVSIFYVSIMRLLSLKFNCLAEHVRSMNSTKKKKLVDNRKLSTMIHHYNRVHLELIEMNEFFQAFSGCSFVHFFG